MIGIVLDTEDREAYRIMSLPFWSFFLEMGWQERGGVYFCYQINTQKFHCLRVWGGGATGKKSCYRGGLSIENRYLLVFNSIIFSTAQSQV